MDTSWLVLLEGILVFGGLLAFGVWQLRALRKLDREDEDDGDGSAAPSGHPEGQQGADPGRSEPVEH